MKRRKAWISCILALVMMASTMFASVVCAAEEIQTATETDADFAEDTSYSLARGNSLNYGTVKISRLSSNEVNLYGLTQCHTACDTVYLSIFLERKVNGTYSTYKYWDFSRDNNTQLMRSMNVIVPSGYYYRIRGYHAAKEGNIRESTTTITQGILVK